MHRRQFLHGALGFAIVRKFKHFGSLDTEHFNVQRISESVFVVRGRPDSGIPTNSAIVVGDNGVAVIDTHLRPSLDEEMIGIVKRITHLPIRYLINTHWHQDHTLGNQIFESFAVIVGHEATKADLTKRVVPNLELQREVLPEQVAQSRQKLDRLRNDPKADSAQLKQLALQVKHDETYLKELPRIRVVLPERTFVESCDLDISRQPIHLLHLGAGHTHGDIVVHLPDEKTILLGDLVTAGQPFMRRRDAVASQWAPTLRRIAALKWDRGVIGHGLVESARERMQILTAFLDALILFVSRAISADVPRDRVAATVLPQLMSFEPHFPYFRQAVYENIERAYEELRGV